MYSKQFCEKNNLDLIYDFDIFQIAEFLEEDSYIEVHCEGYNFLGIGKNNKNEILLAIPVLEDKSENIEIGKKYNSIWKKAKEIL
jgi:hypothetical protein